MNVKTQKFKQQKNVDQPSPLIRNEGNVFSNRTSIRPRRSFKGLKSIKPFVTSKNKISHDK
jgi:hypothetical protein